MNTKNMIITVVVVIVLVLVGYFTIKAITSNNSGNGGPASAIDAFENLSSTSSDAGKNQRDAQSLGMQTSPIPWYAEINHLRARLNEIGLPALAKEGTLLHTHQHLDIFIHGKQVNVPINIGINNEEGFISPIHTHSEQNIIHVESPTIQKFTLGQFFDIWGLRFNDNCIGAYCADSSAKLQIFVNGKEVLSNFRDVELTAHEEIVVIYGETNEMPPVVPVSFTFPEGL